jgi:glucose-fructose oxidoreductase
MAVTEKDCQAMLRACGKARVLLMIAYRLHFTEAHLRAIEFVKRGGIGQLRYFNSLFAMQVAAGNIRTDRDLGGGPLPDIGVYCINASRYLFRDEPVQVYATSAAGKDRRFKEVMEMASVVLTFPGNRLATFTCSFGSSDMDQFDLVGTEGSIHMEPAFAYEGSLKWVVKRGDKPKDKTQEHSFPPGDQFAAEIDYFSECILKKRVPEPSGEEGLADVRILNAIMESIRTKRPVSLKPMPGAGKRRPASSQLIRRRPARKTQLVGVDTPHRG